jgi:hypothetical protein
MRLTDLFAVGLISLCMLPNLGCGSGSSSSSTTQPITQVQATQVGLQVYHAVMSAALGVPGSGTNATLSAAYKCQLGGTIQVSGTSTYSLASGTNMDLTETPANCDISPSILIGDPNLTFTYSYQVGRTSSSTSGTITGGLTVAPDSSTPGIFPTGTCQINETYNISASSGSATTCSISGTACNQTVSTSCE